MRLFFYLRVSLPPMQIAARPKDEGRMSDLIFRAQLCCLKVDFVHHGLHSSLRDWCAENGIARILSGSALSHSLGGAVETAYLRSDLAEQRELMQQWADFCSTAGF